MFIAEGLALRHHDPVWLALGRRWSKAFGILFAVGAVSGTVISFELGLLWPKFMRYAGGIIGLPFSLEGRRRHLCETVPIDPAQRFTVVGAAPVERSSSGVHCAPPAARSTTPARESS